MFHHVFNPILKKYLPFELSSSKVSNYQSSSIKSKFFKKLLILSLCEWLRQWWMWEVHLLLLHLHMRWPFVLKRSQHFLLSKSFYSSSRLTVVTSGSVIVLSGEVNHPLSCFLTSLLEMYTSLFKKVFYKSKL